MQLLYFFIWKTYLASKAIMRYMVCYLYIFKIIIKYSWKLRKIIMNRKIFGQITIFINRNNFHYLKLWRIAIGIYLWPKYQRMDLWRIYSQTICKLFANRELLAEHCTVLYCTILHSILYCTVLSMVYITAHAELPGLNGWRQFL